MLTGIRKMLLSKKSLQLIAECVEYAIRRADDEADYDSADELREAFKELEKVETRD